MGEIQDMDINPAACQRFGLPATKEEIYRENRCQFYLCARGVRGWHECLKKWKIMGTIQQ